MNKKGFPLKLIIIILTIIIVFLSLYSFVLIGFNLQDYIALNDYAGDEKAMTAYLFEQGIFLILIDVFLIIALFFIAKNAKK
ncbi:hypothetical protein [Apibacter sp.]|uniref:hypothetical protein n=1 Tax=Apibacter sp. TaxID=2023709 RepID=UPI0025CDFA3C|nr:hypothetical protein [Apibacter sp.]MCT6870163.1 hypothetical protein [Apibacter sp.]